MILFKRLIKRIVIQLSSLFYFTKKSKVLFYHDIHSKNKYTEMSTHIDLFKKHIQIINQSGYEIVSKITKEYGQVELCFDDAFLGLYKNIGFLKKNQIPVHLFVVSSYLERDCYINRKQLVELSKLNLITISSHTHSHNRLDQIDENAIKKELVDSKHILEDLLKIRIDSICYPEGIFNKKIINIANSVGYHKQYSSLPGFFMDQIELHVVKRSLVQFASEKEFKAILKGGDHVLGFWYKFKHFKR